MAFNSRLPPRRSVKAALASVKSLMGKTQEADELFALSIEGLRKLKHPGLPGCLMMQLEHAQRTDNKAATAAIQSELDSLRKRR